MPLTEEERQEILARRQQLNPPTIPGPTIPGVIPPGMAPYVSGTTISRSGPGMRITYPKPPAVVERELEIERRRRQMQAETPLPTETERERTPMARTSVQFLDQFAQNLGLTTEDGKPAIQHPEKVAPSFAREIVPQKFQDYVLSEESSIIYNDLESAFQLGSIVLTGRQGDLQKLQQIRDVYSFGGAIKDKPKLALHRYQNLRRLFQTFDRAAVASPNQQQQVLDEASKQMDQLLTKQDIGLSSKAQALLERYRRTQP